MQQKRHSHPGGSSSIYLDGGVTVFFRERWIVIAETESTISNSTAFSASNGIVQRLVPCGLSATGQLHDTSIEFTIKIDVWFSSGGFAFDGRVQPLLDKTLFHIFYRPGAYTQSFCSILYHERFAVVLSLIAQQQRSGMGKFCSGNFSLAGQLLKLFSFF